MTHRHVLNASIEVDLAFRHKAVTRVEVQSMQLRRQDHFQVMATTRLVDQRVKQTEPTPSR